MPMNPPSSRLLTFALHSCRLLGGSLVALPLLANAANGTWDGGGPDANWTSSANWTGDVASPGSTSGTGNTDVATFNSAIANTWGAPGTPIVIDSPTLGLGGITFGTSSVGNYTIGTTDGNALHLTSGGVIQILDTATNNPTETISAPLVIVGDGATYSFNNARNNITTKLILNGSITVNGAGDAVLTFDSKQSGSPNEANGVISDGTADSVSLVHNSGTWYYTGDNTYTGDTTINGGTARFTGDNSGGGDFTINSGGSAIFTGTNSYAGTFTLNSGASNAQATLGGAASATGSILGVTEINLNGARFYVDNTAGAADRLNDNVAINIGGENAIFSLTGNAAVDTSETVGTITLGQGRANINISGLQNRVTTLNAASLTRAAGSGSLFLDARSLGTGTSYATRFNLASAPTGADLVGSGGAASGANSGIKNLGILPWIYGSSAGIGTFVTYDTANGLRFLASNETVSTIAAAAAPAPGGTGDNVVLTTDETGVTTKTINSLMLRPAAAQAVTGAGAGNHLVISSGALANSGAHATTLSGFDTITFGNGEAVITAQHGNSSIRIDSSIDVTDGGGLTKTGAGNVILTADNAYAGDTVVNQGVLQIGAGGTTGDLGSGDVILNRGTTLAYERTDTLAIGSVSGGGNLQVNQATGELILTQSGTGNVVNNITGAAGSTVAFAGDGETIVSTKLATADQTIRVDSGTVNLADSRQTIANLEITGGVLNTTDGQFSMRRTDGGTQTLVISGGQFNVTGEYGLKGLNNDNWSNSGATTFVGTQTGGVFSITGGNSDGFQLGNDTAGASSTYTLSGGLLSYTGSASDGFLLRANSAGTSTTTFNLAGGTLRSAQDITGHQSGDARQAFVWTGGVLATFGYDATRISSEAGVSISTGAGTLVNGGGTLAPGDIGIVGRTIIVGNYDVASSEAAMHIDIGGTTGSGAFQHEAGSGRYDSVTIGGSNRTVTLDGKLFVDVIDGFDGNGTFDILTNTGSGGSINGAFTNTVTDALGEGARVVTGDGLGSYLLTYGSTAVSLSSFVAENVWAGFNGSDWTESTNWSAFAPQFAGHVAKFDDTATDTGVHVINLDADLTVGGLAFDSADHAYAISSGSGRGLTLDNTGAAGARDSAITVTRGSHTVAVPLTLANNLGVSTAAASSLTISGAIGGTGRSVEKTGAGSLVLTAGNTYDGGTSVAAGTLFVNNTAGSGVGSGGLDVASGATLAGSGFIGGVSTISGQVAPGASAGSIAVLTFDAGANFLAGSSIGVDINGAGARGVDFDGLTFNAALSIAGADLTFNFGAAIADGAVLDIFDGASLTASFGSVSATGFGNYNGTFALNGSQTAYTAVFGNQLLSLDLATGALSFAAAAVPEPSAAALLAGAGALLAGIVRRRRRTR